MKLPKQSFSPIITEERLQEALEYIASLSGKLAEVCLGFRLPIDTLCIFAQNSKEYDFLLSAVQNRGPLSEFTHGATTYVETKFAVAGQNIQILGVRAPDPTRPQVGYGDYPVNNYQQLLDDIAANPYANEIKSSRGQSLIELHYPDFDILGYVFDENEHS